MQIEVMNITIVKSGPDKLFLCTTLPNGTWPYKGCASLCLDVAADTGKDYCAKNFPGIPVEVIDPSKMRR